MEEESAGTLEGRRLVGIEGSSIREDGLLGISDRELESRLREALLLVKLLDEPFDLSEEADGFLRAIGRIDGCVSFRLTALDVLLLGMMILIERREWKGNGRGLKNGEGAQ